MSARTSNAFIEKSVRKMQGTVHTIVAYIEEVHGTTSDLGSASSIRTGDHGTCGQQIQSHVGSFGQI